MKVHEFINEVGDSYYDVEHTPKKSPSLNRIIKGHKLDMPPPLAGDYFDFTTKAGTNYGIHINKMKTGDGFTGIGLAFGNYDVEKVHSITGSGDSIKVFATVKNVLAKYLTEHPEIYFISFTAKKNEPSRVKLYNTFAQQFKRWFPEFKEIQIRQHPDYVQYIIEKGKNK